MDNLKAMLSGSRRISIALWSFALCLSLLSGCILNQSSQQAADYYYLNPTKDLSTAGRVVVVELDNDSTYPQISSEMTEALFQSIQKKQLFGITIIRQNDTIYRSLQLDSGPPYNLDQLVNMRRQLNCNAILIGTVNTYQPFPHTSIGLELRLIDLADGQLLWALEQIWDATDKTTEQRIAAYYKAEMRSGLAELQEQLVMVSPLKFVKFVAYEIAETLQSQR